MKNIYILIIVLFSALSLQAQKLESKLVPTLVKNALQKNYAKVKQVEWNKEDNLYEASFEIDEMDISLLIDSTGKILETEKEIELSELPKAISVDLKSNYPDKKLQEGSKIIDSSGHIFYEAEIKGKELLFDEKGNFIREIKD
ncbi:MAG: PepSY-like domain-containing protein [Bacteroidetes bacterium]|nr:PepSY-like domain-containing protein [Bacteroidota bacterium]